MPADFTTLAESRQPADPAAPRHVSLAIGKRGPLHRALIRDSAAPGKGEASAMDYDWRLALIGARDRAGGRGVASDADGAALLAAAIAECEAVMATRGT